LKLYESELKVMDILWENGNLPAGKLAKILKEEIGWNRNTTYTVVKKCINKGAIKRLEPNFICEAIISKEEVQKYETTELIDRMFDGSPEMFFSTFLNSGYLAQDDILKLKQYIEEKK